MSQSSRTRIQSTPESRIKKPVAKALLPFFLLPVILGLCFLISSSGIKKIIS